MQRLSEFGQPISYDVPGWSPPPFPPWKQMEGRYSTLEPLNPTKHVPDLFKAFSKSNDSIWTYMKYGPFKTEEALMETMLAKTAAKDPQFYAIIPKETGKPEGLASYLRIDPGNGSIEVGSITYADSIKNSPVGTETMYLMMRNAFELGYRRYEWKCDALNAKSKAAAERLGMTYECTFRQGTSYKGRNRDNAWLAIMDFEWPAMKEAFEAWLSPENFGPDGKQKKRLQDFRKAK